MCSLDRPDQSDSSPHVHVSVQCTRVRHLVFGGGDAQDGLQVTRLPKDPSLRSQSIPTQSPELQAHTRTLFEPISIQEPAVSSRSRTNLDVFDSTADHPTGLDRIPGHIEDLGDRRCKSEEETGQMVFTPKQRDGVRGGAYSV